MDGTAARADTVLYGAVWPCNESPSWSALACPKTSEPGSPSPHSGLKHHSTQDPALLGLLQGLVEAGSPAQEPPLSPALSPKELHTAKDPVGSMWFLSSGNWLVLERKDDVFSRRITPRQ